MVKFIKKRPFLSFFLLIIFGIVALYNIRPSITIENRSSQKLYIYNMQYRDGKATAEEYDDDELRSQVKPFATLFPEEKITLYLDLDYFFSSEPYIFGGGWLYEKDEYGVGSEDYIASGLSGLCNIYITVNDKEHHTDLSRFQKLCFKKLTPFKIN